MKRFFWYEVVLIASIVFGGVYIATSPFVRYSLQIIAGLFITYIVFRKKITKHPKFFFGEVAIFIFIIILIVFSTGGLHSPLFFLLYFLLFASALLLGSAITLILSVMLVVAFFAIADYTYSLESLLPIVSLIFITPFAKYLGELEHRYAQQKRKLNILLEANKHLSSLEKYEKEQTLLFLTTILYRHFDDIQERVDNFMGDTDLSYLKEKMKQLRRVIQQFQKYVEAI